jgi:hypothetical protein
MASVRDLLPVNRFMQALNWVSMAATVDCQVETSANIYYLKKKLKNSFLTEIIFIIY